MPRGAGRHRFEAEPVPVLPSRSGRPSGSFFLPRCSAADQQSTKPLSMAAASGRVNLPIGMILRCLPPEVLAADITEFEATGAAATEIGLPMNMILSQLPSGKVEMSLADLVPHFPAGYLQPTESIASYLPTIISLPLMDVVMRIPPDLLALRPDQKDVDASIINMADPFTEEILREQAEAARRQTQTNIIDESQVPQAEEFVPQAQAAAAKTPLSSALRVRPPFLCPPPQRASDARPQPMPTPPMPSAPALPARSGGSSDRIWYSCGPIRLFPRRHPMRLRALFPLQAGSRRPRGRPLPSPRPPASDTAPIAFHRSAGGKLFQPAPRSSNRFPASPVSSSRGCCCATIFDGSPPSPGSSSNATRPGFADSYRHCSTTSCFHTAARSPGSSRICPGRRTCRRCRSFISTRCISR